MGVTLPHPLTCAERFLLVCVEHEGHGEVGNVLQSFSDLISSPAGGVVVGSAVL